MCGVTRFHLMRKKVQPLARELLVVKAFFQRIGLLRRREPPTFSPSVNFVTSDQDNTMAVTAITFQTTETALLQLFVLSSRAR